MKEGGRRKEGREEGPMRDAPRPDIADHFTCGRHTTMCSVHSDTHTQTTRDITKTDYWVRVVCTFPSKAERNRNNEFSLLSPGGLHRNKELTSD